MISSQHEILLSPSEPGDPESDLMDDEEESAAVDERDSIDAMDMDIDEDEDKGDRWRLPLVRCLPQRTRFRACDRANQVCATCTSLYTRSQPANTIHTHSITHPHLQAQRTTTTTRMMKMMPKCLTAEALGPEHVCANGA
jgi:hypothetical protein